MPPPRRVRPANAAMKGRLMSIFTRSVAASNAFPVTLQVHFLIVSQQVSFYCLKDSTGSKGTGLLPQGQQTSCQVLDIILEKAKLSEDRSEDSCTSTSQCQVLSEPCKVVLQRSLKPFARSWIVPASEHQLVGHSLSAEGQEPQMGGDYTGKAFLCSIHAV